MLQSMGSQSQTRLNKVPSRHHRAALPTSGHTRAHRTARRPGLGGSRPGGRAQRWGRGWRWGQKAGVGRPGLGRGRSAAEGPRMRRTSARAGSPPSVMLRPPNPAGGPWGPRALGSGPPERSHPRGHPSWPVPRARGAEGPGAVRGPHPLLCTPRGGSRGKGRAEVPVRPQGGGRGATLVTVGPAGPGPWGQRGPVVSGWAGHYWPGGLDDHRETPENGRQCEPPALEGVVQRQRPQTLRTKGDWASSL